MNTADRSIENNCAVYARLFLEEREAAGLKPRSLDLYRRTLALFLTTLHRRNVQSAEEITAQDVQAHIIFLYEKKTKSGSRHFSRATQAYHVLFLKKFFAFLVHEKAIEKNPAVHINPPRARKSARLNLFTPDELARFFAAMPLGAVVEARNRVIFELYYSAGLRLGEIIHMKNACLNLEDSFLAVRQTKTGEDRSVPLVTYAAKWLAYYLAHIRPRLDRNHTAPWLFLSLKGKQLSDVYLSEYFKKILAQSGIQKKLTIHAFRYSIATHLLDSGLDVRYIQKFLGHKRLDTTQRYTKVNIARLREIVNTCHPDMKQRRENHEQ